MRGKKSSSTRAKIIQSALVDMENLFEEISDIEFLMTEKISQQFADFACTLH